MPDDAAKLRRPALLRPYGLLTEFISHKDTQEKGAGRLPKSTVSGVLPIALRAEREISRNQIASDGMAAPIVNDL